MAKGILGLRSYQLYLEECEFFEIDPLSYSDWIEKEEYEQRMIDLSLMTDAERYGEDD